MFNASASAQVRNEKARRFLLNMRKKPGVNFATYFPRADPGAVALLRRMLSFDPADRPTSEVQSCDFHRHLVGVFCRDMSVPPASVTLSCSHNREFTQQGKPG